MAYSNYTIPASQVPPMVSAQGYDMPQAQLPQSQTAAIPADGGFTVGDALKKKRIAEALRAKVSQDYEQQAPTGHAAANGNFPGETYINYGNILQNAMQPWLEGRREKKAGAAEDEAMSARDEALSSSNFDPKTATVQQIQALQDLGVSGDAISAVMERDTTAPKDNTGALSQLLQTRQGVTYADMAGLIPPGSAPEYIKMIEEAEAAKNRGKGGTGGSSSQSKSKVLGPMYAQLSLMDQNSEEAKELSAKIAHIESLDNANTGGESSGGYIPSERSFLIKEMSAIRGAAQSIHQLQAQEELVDELLADDEGFGTFQRLAQGLSSGGNGMGSEGFTDHIAQAVAAGQVHPGAVVLNQIFQDAVKESLKAAGGSDSNLELTWAKNNMPSFMTSPEAARAGWARLKLLNAVNARAAEMKQEDYENEVYMKKGGRKNYFDDAAAELGYQKGSKAWSDIAKQFKPKKKTWGADPSAAADTTGVPEGIDPENWKYYTPQDKALYDN